MLYIDRGCHEKVIITTANGYRYKIIVDHLSMESGSYGAAVLKVENDRDSATYIFQPGEVADLPGDVEMMIGHIKISSDRDRVANGSVRLLFNAPRNVKIMREELQ